MAPPNQNGAGLDLGGQNLGDFLSTAETSDLRRRYYDLLDTGLKGASQPAQPDQANLFWTGIVPAIATAILTKGKALKFAGPPLLNTLATEQKRADDQQNLDLNVKLKGAGLLGEELGRRENIIATAANKEEDRQARKEMAQEANQIKLDIFNQSDATRREVAAMTAGASSENRKFQQELQSEKLVEGEKKGIQDTFAKEIKDRGIDQKIEGLRSAEAVLNGEYLGPSGLQLAKEGITRAILLSKPANAAIQKLAPGDAESWVNETINAATSSVRTPASKAKVEELKQVASLLKEEAAKGIVEVHRSLGASGRGAYLKKTGEYRPLMDSLTSGYGVDLPKSSSISPEKSYSTPNGAIISGADALQRYGNNPAALNLLKEAQ